MRIIAATLAFFVVCGGSVMAQTSVTRPMIQIYAGPLHREYLGCLNCDQFDPLSIWNNYGAFGLDNVFPEMSRYATFRAAHGRYSVCDPLAADPPILIDNARNGYGVLNVSTRRADATCGPHGDPGLCQNLKAMCDRHTSGAE
jgi:hypothetical protein